MNSAIIFAGTDGNLRFIYDDELVDVLGLGAATVARASDVEPASGGWSADMARSNGPVLGPFPLRSDAIAAEVDWLQERILP